MPSERSWWPCMPQGQSWVQWGSMVSRKLERSEAVWGHSSLCWLKREFRENPPRSCRVQWISRKPREPRKLNQARASLGLAKLFGKRNRMAAVAGQGNGFVSWGHPQILSVYPWCWTFGRVLERLLFIQHHMALWEIDDSVLQRCPQSLGEAKRQPKRGPSLTVVLHQAYQLKTDQLRWKVTWFFGHSMPNDLTTLV